MEINTSEIPVGVVGLGLMGSSITTCFLMSGHPVVAIAPISDDLKHAEPRIRHHLEKSLEEGLTTEKPAYFLKNLVISEDYSELKNCRLVVECTLENEGIKKSVYEKIEKVIAPDALLASNTSAIPISILQRLTTRPERFFGLHWSEPSHTTRFLEIICGELSDIEKAEYLYALSHYWQKEPTLVRKDIRGFITNRLMYAMYREAFYLVENGYATVEDVDRACRNNAGYWMTLVGLFRWMDLTGVAAYHNVMKDLFPTLSNATEVPQLIDDIVKAGGRGVSNAHGFYEYTPEEAKLWEETYNDFSYDVRKLALKYPADVVKKKMAAKAKQTKNEDKKDIKTNQKFSNMEKREIVHPDKADKNFTTGAYSAGVAIDGWLYVSGQGPVNFATGKFELGDIEYETRLTLQNVRRICEAAGCTLDDIVKCTVHLSDIKDFDRYNAVYATHFTSIRPARTTVQSGLGHGIKVEIDAIAKIPSHIADTTNTYE